MAHRDVVVVAASAGGLEPLRALVSALPADFPASVLAVLHVPASGSSALASILSRDSELPVHAARTGMPLESGHIYIAPPDHHLLVRDDHIALSHGPRENGHRPAADPLFRSAALHRGPRVVGVVLSGALDDGTAGLATVRARGGTAIVQDPDEAVHPSMPRNALESAGADHVVPSAEIAPLLVRLCKEEVDFAEPVAPAPSVLREEVSIALMDPAAMHAPERPGTPAGLSCPDCHGTLYELQGEGAPLHYRCRVGHAWSPESLLAEQGQALEEALWMALRTLEEKASLTLRLANDATDGGRHLTAERFRSSSREAHGAAESIRAFLAADAAAADTTAAGTDEQGTAG